MADKDRKPADNTDAELWPYRKTKAERARDVIDLSDRALRENCYRATRAYRFGSLFEGYTLSNLSSWGADVSGGINGTMLFPGLETPLIKNRCRQLCKTFVNKSFANDSPRGQFVTKGGDYEQVLKAELLGQSVDADFAEEHGQFADIDEMWRHGALIATSATGTCGIWAIDYENLERPEGELDDSLTWGIYRAQRYGAIRMMVRSLWMQPEEAVRKLAKTAEDRRMIFDAVETRESLFEAGKGVGGSNMAERENLQRREVRVVMAWSVACGSEKGRQIFVLHKNEHVLRDREYDKPKPPVAIWSYDVELGGEFGTPLTQSVYQLSMYQNRILHDVDTAERKTSQVIVAVQKGSQGQKAMTSQVVNTKAVQVIEVDGPVDSAMKIFESPKFSRDSLALEAVYDNAQYEDTGIAKRQATGGGGGKPGESGVHESLNASYYTENFADAERRAIHARAIKTTRIFLWVLQSIAKTGFSKWVGDDEFRREIRDTDLDMDEDRYILGLKPVSEGKDSPKAQLEKADRLLQDPSIQFNGRDWLEAQRTFDVPRMIEQATEFDEWVREQIKRWQKSPEDELTKPDFYQPPEIWVGLDNLRSMLNIAALAHFKARQTKVPERRLALFERFCNECTTLIQREEKRLATLAQPAPPAGGAAPPGPPPAQAA